MLRITDTGTLDVRSVDGLSPADLEQWIWDRLHGTDTAAPDDPRQNVGQYYLVGAIYPSLAAATRAEVRRVLVRFLRQMEAGEEDWDALPGDALLLLVMKVGDPDLAAPIRRMAEREQFLSGAEADEDRHARLVQALADLGDKVTPAFWKREAARDPERFLALAFAGLRLHSVYQALGLLCGVDELDEETQVRLYPVLRGLLNRQGTTLDDLRVALRDMFTALPPTDLSPSVRAFLRETLPEAWQGFDVEPAVAPEPTISDKVREAANWLTESGATLVPDERWGAAVAVE